MSTALTLTQYRARVRQILNFENQTDADEPTGIQSNLTRLLNTTRNVDWARIIPSLGRRLTTRTTMTYTANQETVALAAGLVGRPIVDVEATPPSAGDPLYRYTLDPAVQEEFDNYEAYGDPERFLHNMLAGTIAVKPVPKVDTTLTLWYVAALTQLSANGDIPTETMVEVQDIHAYGASAMYMAERGDDQAVIAPVRAVHDQLWETWKELISAMYRDTHAKRYQWRLNRR